MTHGSPSSHNWCHHPGPFVTWLNSGDGSIHRSILCVWTILLKGRVELVHCWKWIGFSHQLSICTRLHFNWWIIQRKESQHFSVLVFLPPLSPSDSQTRCGCTSWCRAWWICVRCAVGNLQGMDYSFSCLHHYCGWETQLDRCTVQCSRYQIYPSLYV